MKTKLTGGKVRPIGTGWYVIKSAEWRYQRPVTEAKRCHNCGTCALYCPVGARYREEKHFETDLDYCKGCGICAVECYASAITMIEEAEK